MEQLSKQRSEEVRQPTSSGEEVRQPAKQSTEEVRQPTSSNGEAQQFAQPKEIRQR